LELTGDEFGVNPVHADKKEGRRQKWLSSFIIFNRVCCDIVEKNS
tara:strand:- start:350 stop:484 length:135 start_codon:yes stop_codon:yes gene_type:complete